MIKTKLEAQIPQLSLFLAHLPYPHSAPLLQVSLRLPLLFPLTIRLERYIRPTSDEATGKSDFLDSSCCSSFTSLFSVSFSSSSLLDSQSFFFRLSVVGVGTLRVFLIFSGASKKRSSRALISQLKISFAKKGNLYSFMSINHTCVLCCGWRSQVASL